MQQTVLEVELCTWIHLSDVSKISVTIVSAEGGWRNVLAQIIEKRDKEKNTVPIQRKGRINSRDPKAC